MSGTTIYYFSGTGNSLVVARAIAAKLGDTKLVHMAGPNAAQPSPETPTIGLVFPVYIFGLPLIVTRLIKNIRVPDNAYLFAVAVNGGLACSTIIQAARLFNERGLQLAAGFAVTMVDNYTPLGGAMPAKKQKIRFEKAGQKLEKICASIKNRESTLYRGLPLVNWLFSGLMYKNAAPKIPGMDKNFTADSNCNGCGVCEKACPMGNIAMTRERPEWRHHCEMCFTCLQWCPTQAIQYGKNTTGKARYHHPEVTLKDITARDGIRIGS
jgi:ferredoxin